MDNHSRILIVDDDQDSLTNVADILSDVGFETHTADSAESALDQYFESSDGSLSPTFDLCLLDFKMPGMDGVELFERMKQASPGLRAILVTAYAGNDGIDRAQRAGTFRVLRKPVDVKLLIELVYAALN